ncbi:MAG: hypothetical protein WDZ77_01010 [Candidatus Pacearchaeota archaeon]
MKTKRAFLLAEETLKIVLALISIGFLVYFLSALYFSDNTSEDLKFAEASLSNLGDALSSKISELQIYNPQGWVLISFSVGNEDFPRACSNFAWENCLCLTNNLNLFKGVFLDDEITCLETEYSIPGKQIDLDNLPITLELNHESKEISLR